MNKKETHKVDTGLTSKKGLIPPEKTLINKKKKSYFEVVQKAFVKLRASFWELCGIIIKCYNEGIAELFVKQN